MTLSEERIQQQSRLCYKWIDEPYGLLSANALDAPNTGQKTTRKKAAPARFSLDDFIVQAT